MSLLGEALDMMEEAQQEVATVSYNELRSEYNNRRRKGTMKYTFNKFLEQTGLDNRIMKDPKTGSRCFIADDIASAMHNYSSSLKQWKSSAKGRRPQTKAERAKSVATVTYGRVAAKAMDKCSSGLKKKYGVGKKKKNCKLSDLHNELMAEFKNIDPKGAAELDGLYKEYKSFS